MIDVLINFMKMVVCGVLHAGVMMKLYVCNVKRIGMKLYHHFIHMCGTVEISGYLQKKEKWVPLDQRQNVLKIQELQDVCVILGQIKDAEDLLLFKINALLNLMECLRSKHRHLVLKEFHQMKFNTLVMKIFK